VAADKPYDQMSREIITATGPNSYDVANGQINFIVNGVVTGGPTQDIFDQQTANVADVFLGITHLNCLLCHNGAGHLTGLSLWGQQQTRYNAWGMAAFLSHTSTTSTAVSSAATTALLGRRGHHHEKLSAQHHDRQSPSPPAHWHGHYRISDLYLHRRNPRGRTELPPGVRQHDHRRSAVRACGR
jgi:hypothetical protein